MRDEINFNHHRSWELLPWLVNGTLPAEQVEFIEQHAAQCTACTAELQVLRQLQTQLRDSDALMLAPQTSWQKMSERLDREEELLTGHDAAIPRRGAQQSGRVALAAYKWPAIAAAQTVAILGLLAALAWAPRPAQSTLANERSVAMPAQYATLTSATDVNTQSALRVVFRSDAPLSDINALLRALPAQVIGGPSEAGVYTVGVPSNATALPQLLARLRADARIVFVEPTSAAATAANAAASRK